LAQKQRQPPAVRPDALARIASMQLTQVGVVALDEIQQRLDCAA